MSKGWETQIIDSLNCISFTTCEVEDRQSMSLVVLFQGWTSHSSMRLWPSASWWLYGPQLSAPARQGTTMGWLHGVIDGSSWVLVYTTSWFTPHVYFDVPKNFFPISAVAFARNTSSLNSSQGTATSANAPGPVDWRRHHLISSMMLGSLMVHIAPTVWTFCHRQVLRHLAITHGAKYFLCQLLFRGSYNYIYRYI